MRFLHTADWQIGMKCRHVGSVGSRIRQERIDAVVRLIDEANAANVDFVLVAGDVFESNGVEGLLIQKVADILSQSRSPVYLLPGNHDPLTPGSVWDHPAWAQSDKLNVLREQQPIALEGGILYPCPLCESRSGKDPTAWIDAREGIGIRIGLAHGTVESIHQDEPDYPLPLDAAQLRGLDYLALGHWHSFTPYSDRQGVVRMAYSGSHDQTKFGERESGSCLIVDIEGPGAPPTLKTIRTGGLEWLTIERQLLGKDDISRLVADIEAISNASETLLELKLSGLMPASGTVGLERVRELLASRFLFARVDDSQLLPSPKDEGWLASLPPGILRDVAAELLVRSSTKQEESSRRIATRALMELCFLSEASKS